MHIPVSDPFDFDLTVKFLRGFSPMMGEVAISERALEKTWLHQRQPVTASVRAGEGGLWVDLSSPEPIDEGAERAVAERVAFFLGANDELADFHERAERDRAFAPLARRLRGLHHPKFPTPFEAACWSVVNQRIALAQARKMKAAIVARWGDAATDAFPEPKTLAEATEAELARAIGNQRKARAVFAVSQAFADLDEKWLQTAPLDEVEARLRRIWGVGDFSVAFILYRGLGRSLPPPLGLPWSPKFVEAAEKTYGRVTRRDLEKKAESFGPWIGYWSLYLWASTFVNTR